MKALIQRVKEADVSVSDKIVSAIGEGFLIFIGICSRDTRGDVAKIAKKILSLRIFNDCDNKINFNILDIKGEILLVSQFTLCADIKKGNRPSFQNAMEPQKAAGLFDSLKKELSIYINTKTGKFGSIMKVSLINDGPMTIMVETKQ